MIRAIVVVSVDVYRPLAGHVYLEAVCLADTAVDGGLEVVFFFRFALIASVPESEVWIYLYLSEATRFRLILLIVEFFDDIFKLPLSAVLVVVVSVLVVGQFSVLIELIVVVFSVE